MSVIKFVYVSVFTTLLGLMVQPSAAQAATSMAKPAATPAVNTCVTQTSPPAKAVGETPAMNMPVIDPLPPDPGHLYWDGADRANKIVQAGSTLIVGGRYKSVHWQGKKYWRGGFVSFDARTGQPTPLAPMFDGEILDMAVSCKGDAVYVVGSFHNVTVNGQTFVRNNAAKISLTTGSVLGWNPNANRSVETVAVVRKHVVIGGNFTELGGKATSQVASVNKKTGVVTSWLRLRFSDIRQGQPSKIRMFVPNHGATTAVMTGNFGRINGKRHYRVALVDISRNKAAKLLPWYTRWTNGENRRACISSYRMRYVIEQGASWTPNDKYFGLSTTGGSHKNSLCDTASLWSASTKSLVDKTADPKWISYTGGDSLSMNVLSNKSMFVAGHNRLCGTTPRMGVFTPDIERPGICEISVKTGKVTGWNPTRSRQWGMHISGLLNEQGLWIASDGQTCAGKARNNLCLLPYAD